MTTRASPAIGERLLTFSRPLLLKIFNGLNARCEAHAGGDTRPVFYDIDETYPSLRTLDRNFAAIKSELNAVLSGIGALPRYHELDHHQDEISGNDDKNWRVFMLNVVGKTPRDAATLCPRTVSLLNEIPYVNQAFFSILEPGKSVPAHDGVYCGYLRYHLGLSIPENDPPALRVKDKLYTWKEGESILFDDSWNHEVINESDDFRIVLLVDVLRPMPKPTALMNLAWTRGVGHLYSNKVLAKLDDFRLDGQK
ncbi:MAG: aspartyl/asparaginyl beta-hydroxylase domain-containing protein [Pseudomonadota bacterium]